MWNISACSRSCLSLPSETLPEPNKMFALKDWRFCLSRFEHLNEQLQLKLAQTDANPLRLTSLNTLNN